MELDRLSRRTNTGTFSGVDLSNGNTRPQSLIPSQHNGDDDNSYERPDTMLMDDPAKKQQQQRSSGWWSACKRFLKDTWFVEVTGLTISLIATAAIIVGLKYFHNKPSQDWNYWMTPNKSLSILSTIARTSLLVPIGSGLSQLKWLYYKEDRKLIKFQTLDGASRGPFGAFLLLFSLGNLMALLGAFLTMGALGYEPMTQFSLRFKNNATRFGDATIPRSQAFRNNCLINGTDGTKEIDIGMKMAMSSGLYYSNYTQTSMAITANCSTGTCDFDNYGSLSLCSQCTDVTSQIQSQTQNFRLPNGLSLTDGARMNSTTCDKLNTDAYDSIRSVVANFSIIGQTQDLTSCQKSSGPTSYGDITPAAGGTLFAYDCIMSFCVEQFEASVNRSILWENLTHTFYDKSSPIQDALAPVRDLLIETPDSWLPQGANTKFVVQKDNLGAVASYLKNLLEGNVTDNCNPVYSSDHINALWSSGLENINKSISNLARSATNSIRTLNASESVVGDAEQYTVVIEVQWWYLAFPVALETLATVFLAATIVLTAMGKVPMWKSSALAGMFHGIDAAEIFAETTASLKKTSEIEDYADGKVVKLLLSPGRQGYQLVGTSRS